jgi:hypothetical protein
MRSWEIGSYAITKKKAKKDEPPLYQVMTLFIIVVWLLIRNGYAAAKTKSYELLLSARNRLDRVPEPYVTVKKRQTRRARPQPKQYYNPHGIITDEVKVD